jgi:flagellar M-ring protein FliF
VNYEVSETQREVLRAPGSVRRMTVAVMVDGVVATAADGSRTWTPRSEEELTTLRELVASAVGLDEARGDVLTLRSLEFQPLSVPLGTEVTAGLLPDIGALDILSVVQTAVLAIVALVLGLFVIRPILTSAGARQALAAPGAPLALPPASGFAGTALNGEVETGFAIADYPERARDLPGTAGEETPAERLRRLIDQRQTESIEILRGWMEQDEERV